MKFRKTFRVESAHIVRNCYTDRCKKSIHGHSAVIELTLCSNKLDNAGMGMDFKILKELANPLVDMMDHCTMIWKADNEEYKNFIKQHSERWIEFNFNPSAENLALWVHYNTNLLLDSTDFNNGEGNVFVDNVKYHETTTGYAESEHSDLYQCSEDYSISPKDGAHETYGIWEMSDALHDEYRDMMEIQVGYKRHSLCQPAQQVII